MCWSQVPTYACLLVVSAIAILVRAYGIGHQSLWIDELFSRYYPKLFGMEYLWTRGFSLESSPPIYYTLLSGWVSLFGTAEVALRSLSLVASVIAIPVIYLLGLELMSARCGVLAALIFALSPLQIEFAQEARTYALLLLPIGLALLAIARFLGARDREGTDYLFLYGISVVFALYCHSTTIFFILASNLVVVADILASRQPSGRNVLTRWVVTNGLVCLVALPELFVIVRHALSGAGITWIEPLRPLNAVRQLSPVIVGGSTPDWFPGVELSALIVPLLALGVVASRPNRRIWLVLIAIPTVFILLVTITSLYRSIFLIRVFSWLGIPLSLLLAHVFLAKWNLRPVLGVIVATACLTGLGFLHFAPTKPPWRSVLQGNEAQMERTAHIVLSPATEPTPFFYYAPRLTHLAWLGERPKNDIEFGELPDRMGVQRVSLDQVLQWIRSGEGVWLFASRPDMEYVQHLLWRVPGPTKRQEYVCPREVCIIAMAWVSDTLLMLD